MTKKKTKSNSVSRRLLILFKVCGTCLVWMSFANLGYPQGVSVGRDGVELSGFPVPDLEKSGAAWSDKQRSEFETLLNLQIDMIHRDCHLTEKQIRKLRVATKGVLDRRIGIGLKRIGEFSKASGLVPVKDDEDISIRPDKPNEKDGVDALQIYGAKTVGKDVVLFFTRHETSITDHPMWKKILERTLTDQQLTTYRHASKVRNRQLLENAIGKWVSEVDEQLYLSEDQRDKISEHVHGTLTKKVTYLIPNESRKAIKLVEATFRDLDEEIEKILSKQQVERWNQFRKPGDGPTVAWGM